MVRTLSLFRLISTYISNQMLLKTSFTYQVQLQAKSGSTIAHSLKKQWNTNLSTMSTRK